MKKSLIALTVGTLVAAPGLVAAHDYTLFGQAKYEAGMIDDGDDRNAEHSFRGTRLGVRGSVDMDNGMQAIYRLQGNVGADASNFSLNEEVWAGIAGDFGQLRFGRHDRAHKLAVLPFRAFTDTIADAQGFNTQRWGRDVGIHYRTVDINGLTVYVNYAPNGNKANADMGLSAVYKAGPLHIAVAAERMGDKAATSDKYKIDSDGNIVLDRAGAGERDSTTNTTAGVNYAAGDLTAGLLYQNIGVDGADNTVQITLPVTYQIGQIGLRAAVVSLDRDGRDADRDYAVGVEYNFDRRTALFANVWTVGDNERTNYGIGMSRSF